MNKSESIKEIAAALFEFQQHCSKIIKKANNPFFKSKYADLPSILDEIAEPLKISGLVVSQFPDGDGLTTIVMHPKSGEWIEATGKMIPVKLDPQSMGSAITYQRRYALCSVLGLNVDEDDDGNKATQPTQPKDDGKLWLNKGTTEFEKAKEYIANGHSIEDIKKKYRISKEVEGLLK